MLTTATAVRDPRPGTGSGVHPSPCEHAPGCSAPVGILPTFLARALASLCQTRLSDDTMLAAAETVPREPMRRRINAAPVQSSARRLPQTDVPKSELLIDVQSVQDEKPWTPARPCPAPASAVRARVASIRLARCKVLAAAQASNPVLIGRGSFARVYALRYGADQRAACVKAMFIAADAEITTDMCPGLDGVAAMACTPPPPTVQSRWRAPVSPQMDPSTGASSAPSSAASQPTSDSSGGGMVVISVGASEESSPDVVPPTDRASRKRQRDADEAAEREMDDPAVDAAAMAQAEVQMDVSANSFDQEVRALRVLTEVADAQKRDLVAPRLLPHPLTDSCAMLIGMDRADASLSDLHRWLHVATGHRAILMWPDVEHLIWSLFDCLAVAHDQGLVHADLCTRNIFVFREPGTERGEGDALRLRIGDWGSSVVTSARTGLYESHGAAVNYYATRHIRAPEQILPYACPFGAAVDIWAAATAVVEILHGHERATMVFPVEATSGRVPKRYEADDIIRSIRSRIGAPHEGTHWRTLVDDYLATRPTAPSVVAEHRAVLLSKSRPAHAFNEISYALPVALSDPAIGQIAAALDVDRIGWLRTHVANARRYTNPIAQVDAISCQGVVPACTRLLLACLLRWDPTERPTAAQIIAEPRFWSRPIEEIRAHRIRTIGCVRAPYISALPAHPPGVSRTQQPA